MVRPDFYLVDCSFAISSPVFERVNYCQDFLIVDFVVDFRGLEFSGVELSE